MCGSYTSPTTLRGKVAEKLRELYYDIDEQATAHLWVSWLVHAAVGGLLAVLGFGAVTVLAVFAVRELEQVARQMVMGGELYEPWYDYILDVAAPVFVALLIG